MYGKPVTADYDCIINIRLKVNIYYVLWLASAVMHICRHAVGAPTFTWMMTIVVCHLAHCDSRWTLTMVYKSRWGSSLRPISPNRDEHYLSRILQLCNRERIKEIVTCWSRTVPAPTTLSIQTREPTASCSSRWNVAANRRMWVFLGAFLY